MIVASVVWLLLAASSASAEDAAPGTVLRDCTDCPELVVVPAGSFQMGQQEAEPGRAASAVPQHTVTLRSFAMGRTHVTRAEFARFVAASGYEAGSLCIRLTGRVLPNGAFEAVRDASWQSPGFQQTDRDPVVCVNHADATAYVQWLSSQTGRAYRLPSEAEWEYAARAGTTTVHWWGDGQDDACTSANVRDEAFADRFERTARVAQNMFLCRDGYVETAPGASFRPNAFGLYDMLGNAWQWTADCFNASYEGAPADGSAWMTGDCARRILRGGSWAFQPWGVRSAYRLADPVEGRAADGGFRVARDLSP
jgi:formylglycine-generating enzyme required for sulfatase activity